MLYNTKKYVCAYCGKESSYPYISVGHSKGTDDLDFRPPHPYGSFIDTWIKWCPSCGYSAINISAPIADPEMYGRIIKGNRYQTLDGLQLSLVTAQAYYRAALLAEARGDEYGEIRMLQHSIWCCDDNSRYMDDAAVLRRITIQKIKRYLQFHIADRQSYEPMLLVLIDCYRRLSEFEEVLYLYKSERCITRPEYTAAMNYQRDLANARDNRRYDFASVFEVYPVVLKRDEDVYKVDLAKLHGSEYEHISETAEKPEYNPPFNSLSEAFQHEAELGFEDKLNSFVSNMPYSRHTVYEITKALMMSHHYNILYTHLIVTMNEMLTSEEIESVCDYYNRNRND